MAPAVGSPGGGGDETLGGQLCPALVAAAQLRPVGDHQDGDREQGQQQVGHSKLIDVSVGAARRCAPGP